MNPDWCAQRYRANLIDMHIPDEDARFLAHFDAEAYAEALERAQVSVAYLYASSCLGICYWPTRVGHQHAGIGGRDILGERIEQCRRRGIDVVVYYNWWSKWNYTQHPDWRVVSARGQTTAEYLWTPGRYGVCCINSPHADFAVAQVQELCAGYDFDGLWVDMLFWPDKVCYCGHCRRRWFGETGRELPRTVDWEDPDWVAFQRHRERWLAELVGRIAATVRTGKPRATVGFQTAAWPGGWTGGVGSDFFRAGDYLAGDFYGGASEQSLVCKLFMRLGERPLFEYMTSRTPDLADHTTTKPSELLEAQAFAALAHNGRVLFIDAIDPAGTLNPEVYTRIGAAFARIRPYEAYLTPDARPLADVGLYLNFESLIDPADNGKPVQDAGGRRPPALASVSTVARTLAQQHVTYGVLTPRNLGELVDFDTIVVPELYMMDEAEADALRAFVGGGGRLCATGALSLLGKDGKRREEFLLADLLGVSYRGVTSQQVTYLAPVGGHEATFAPFTARHPLQLAGPQVRVAAGAAAQVMATITLPYTDPSDPARFSSAISNPPGMLTTDPAVVLHPYGRGTVLYLAGRLDAAEHEAHRTLYGRLLGLLAGRPPLVRTDLPRAAEVVVWDQPDRRRLLLCVVNFQAELPNIPVHDARLAVRLDGRQPTAVRVFPECRPVEYTLRQDYAELVLPRLDTFLMLGLDYQ